MKLLAIAAVLLSTTAHAIPISVPKTLGQSSETVSGTYIDGALTWDYEAYTYRQVMQTVPGNTVGTFLRMTVTMSGTLPPDSRSSFPIFGPRFGIGPGSYVDGQSGLNCTINGCTRSTGSNPRDLTGHRDYAWGAYWGDTLEVTIGSDPYEFSASMPEPGSAVLMGIGLLLLSRRAKAMS